MDRNLGVANVCGMCECGITGEHDGLQQENTQIAASSTRKLGRHVRVSKHSVQEFANVINMMFDLAKINLDVTKIDLTDLFMI